MTTIAPPCLAPSEPPATLTPEWARFYAEIERLYAERLSGPANEQKAPHALTKRRGG